MPDDPPGPACGPLKEIRVVAFEQAVAMPYCSWVLAEMGADVIKVERRDTGDVIRGWDSAVHGMSTGFVSLNAGKRDIAVDASTPQGAGIIRRLAARADVFLENFAPGVAGRLGLGHETLSALNPGLVYCSLSGYGQTGPYRDVKAYDLLVQGEAGILMTTGYPDGPAKVGVPVADLIAGSNAVAGVVAALYRRRETGEGAFVDISMFDSALSWLTYFPHYQWHAGAIPPRSGMRHQFISPYGPYLASDGRYLNLVIASEDHWRRFCERVVHRPEWTDDPRFATISARKQNRAELEPLVEEVIGSESHDEWVTRFARAGLPYGDVRTIAEVLEHPQVAARRLVVEADSPAGSLPVVRHPLSDPDAPRRLPALGEQADEILAELGFSADEIAGLRSDGVI